ncbi:MAG: bifunctional DNA primase/polymerase [Phycisphaerae bacterium]
MPKREPSSGRPDGTPAATVAAALELLDLGLRPIPCRPGMKIAAVRWGRFQEMSPDANQVREWWRKWPDANLAVLTGTPGGVAVLDLDAGHGAFPPAPGLELPSGYIVATPGGGEHRYFAHVPGLRCSGGRLAHKVDVRAKGGYALIPPSSIGGRPYRVLYGSLADALSEPCPAWLMNLLADGLPDGLSGSARCFLSSGAGKGFRNQALFRAACELAALDVKQHEAEALLREVCRRCRPALPWREAARTIKSAYAEPRTPTLSTDNVDLVIPSDIARRTDLTAPAKMVLAAVTWHEGPCGFHRVENTPGASCAPNPCIPFVFPGIRRLAKLTGLDPATVKRSIAALEQAGRLAVERRVGCVNRYRVLPSAKSAGLPAIRGTGKQQDERQTACMD